MKNRKILFAVILFFLIYQNIFNQENIDDNKKNIDRLLSVFNRHKNNYISMIKDSLYDKFISDSIPQKYNISLDSSYFNQFEYYIIPIFYLNSEAENYEYTDNIFDFFELDTINYECRVYLFKDSILSYYCEYVGMCGHGGVEVPITAPVFWVFYYQFMDDKAKKESEYWINSKIDLLKEYSGDLLFLVKGYFADFLYIRDDTIKIGTQADVIGYHETDLNKYIRKCKLKSQYREIAEDCQPIKSRHKPWWRFLDWFFY